MYALTATYTIEIKFPLRMRFSEDGYLITIESQGFKVEVMFVFEEGSARISYKDGSPDLYAVERMIIKVSRNETEIPPKAKDHGLDTSEVGKWFQDRAPKYRQIAIETANSVIKYFKYKMHVPKLSEYRNNEAGFLSPVWSDEENSNIRTGYFELILTGISPESRNLLSERDFDKLHISKVNNPGLTSGALFLQCKLRLS